ncbi:zinc fingers and homeoboxes protein 2-like [Myxocyprinus asiaticus]|uniref:zinc fingers and homeoboxes protein 2-like n=1 Tax=Myxocyprinus asiaticus TaxID=70543 RepID=UPI002221EA1C|nr:zinc fingers and homeoboxes protein 2-like [Myxocyprinus asiaticus]
MSSRRKLSNPCTVRTTSSTAEDSVEMDLSSESLLYRCSPVPPPVEKNWKSLKGKEKGQMSKGSSSEQGSFYTHNLNDFREHEVSPQSECPLDALYLCTTCKFSTNSFDTLSCHNKLEHQCEGHVKLKKIKLDSQTILEQTTEGENESVPWKPGDSTFPLRLEPSSNSASEDIGKTSVDNSKGLEKELEMEKELDVQVLNDEIRAVSVNGTIIIPEPMSHVTPLLQRPPNLSTALTIAVPFHNSKYNPILDSNTTLITSFNRFPYPTHAELCWLTAASKHPEEQIKVWFTTQRLKQGITWSPEEVEEARKKMFNGSMLPVHQTCTDLPSPVSELVKPSQPFAQSGQQLPGQTRLLSNGTANGSTATCQPVTATAFNQTPVLKRSLGTHLLFSEVKCPLVTTTVDPKERLSMPPPPPPPPERLTIATSAVLTESTESYSAMKKPIIAPFAPPNGKLLMVLPLGPSKEKKPVAHPLMLPKDRLPLSPIVSTNLKRSIVHKQIDNHISISSSGPKNKSSYLGNDVNMPLPTAMIVPQVNRPTIIRTPFSLSAVPPLSSVATPVHQSEPSVAPVTSCSNSQNANGTPCGDAKNWFLDQNAQNDSQRSSELTLRERPVPTHFPLLERVKGKSSGQMKLLEESFQKNSFPSFNEVKHLMISTRLSREKIESWFLQRRVLRDDMEQALLNSMGSKRCPQQYQQALLNGAYNNASAFPFSPVPLDSKSMNLLKNVFVQNSWPSPAELRHLEIQKRLSHTDLVHWFKDSHLAQQSSILQQKMVFEEQNDTSKQPSQNNQLLRDETTKPSSPEIEDWFTNMLGHRWQDMGNSGGLIGEGWEDNAVAVGTRSQLVSDTD